MTGSLPTLTGLARDLASGATTSRKLVEDCLARIEDPAGEGSRAFIRVDGDRVRAAADAMDALRRAGAAPTPYAGIPIAIKDLADIAGDVTAAGSRALADGPAAKHDAPSVARLRRAGFIFIGRANMTEFAYSGLGINPHYGTPASPWARDERRVPGGSSSGSGVSVADGMAHGALGTDTGGSCRVPAAFNGIVGWKPTARRVPIDGVVPLAKSLDSIGPLARTVDCCAIMDAIFANEMPEPLPELPMKGLRLLVPETVVLDSLDEHVAAAFDTALRRLTGAGAMITRAPLPALGNIAAMTGKGGIAAAESYAWHRELLARRGDQYDPRVLARIMRGAEQDAAFYIDLLERRAAAITAYNKATAGFDAVIMPTTPIIAPRIEDAAMTDDDYARANLLVLRNPMMFNILDCCSISIPMHRPGDAPTGLMVVGQRGTDRRTLAISAALAPILQPESAA
jgi:aspartyl-tRNA(Asn)/glutamyl-tRNA(Gln) amidotransferase subunit A